MSSESTAVSISNKNLVRLSKSVPVPGYDRSGLRPAIVHLGVGGFHRAHLAVYVDELCNMGHRDWAIVGTGVLAQDQLMADALVPQDGLYSLITRGPDTTAVRIIGSMVDYLLAAPDPEPVIARIADPATQIVSLTITEGGYPIDDSTGHYTADSPVAGPGSAFGLLAKALDRRRRDGLAGLTVLSCDNILGNGTAAKAATLGEAAGIGQELVAWIEESVTFPNSMVDRITPATADTDRTWLAENHGVGDRWPVVTEPFTQWVVEDDFAADRPPLEDIDVIVTDDVEPYERLKLRLLNAGHSCLAYLAALDGIETVDAAMAEPNIGRFVRALLETEAAPMLDPVAGIEVADYIDSLIERFSNPNIGDQISRLCLDGSAKFPKFLMPTISAQLDHGGPVRLSALAIAGWCQYLGGVDQHGNPIAPLPDPMLDQAMAHAADSKATPAAFLAFTEVFGHDLKDSPVFEAAFVEALQLLRTSGVQSAIQSTLTGR